MKKIKDEWMCIIYTYHFRFERFWLQTLHCKKSLTFVHLNSPDPRDRQIWTILHGKKCWQSLFLKINPTYRKISYILEPYWRFEVVPLNLKISNLLYIRTLLSIWSCFSEFWKYAILESIYKFGLSVWVSVCLFVCLFVSNKRQNG